MGTGFDFSFLSARSYLADFPTPTRNSIGLAPVTVNVFWSELNLDHLLSIFWPTVFFHQNL